MSDWQIGLAIVLLAGLVAALASGDCASWIREEWRRMRADTWASLPTGKDKRVERLEKRQRAMAKRMRKKGRHLYAGKKYVPQLTAPTAEAARPPKADKVVVPINSRTQRKVAS